MLTAELKVVGGRHHGRIIPLNTSKFLVGREQDCHLRPNSEMVSRHHCVFVLDDYTVRLRDLGSTNGTFVNNQRVRGIVALKPGDLVRIGKLDLEVLIHEAVSDDAMAPSETDTVRLSGGETSMLPGLLDSDAHGIERVGDTTVFMNAVPQLEQSADDSSDDETTDEELNTEPDTSTPEMPEHEGHEAAMTHEMAAYNPMMGAPGMPPQPYPMPGYPAPQYPPMGYPYGYQPGMPQYPQPGYPPMPGGYPGFNGYPQPGYGYPQQMQPQIAEPEADYYDEPEEPQQPAKASNGKVSAPPVFLPDPETTGAKEVVIGSDPSHSANKAEGEQAKGQSVPDAINGIFKKMNQRTPG